MPNTKTRVLDKLSDFREVLKTAEESMDLLESLLTYVDPYTGEVNDLDSDTKGRFGPDLLQRINDWRGFDDGE